MSPGEIVAQRYRLDRPLGHGGMGEVWAATHLITGREVALKFVSGGAEGVGGNARVLREARAASAVTHPNVVSVHDVLAGEGGAPVLVMDLLHGESLGDRLAREGRLPWVQVLPVARGILSALEAAHALGIVHRDLKPDNVFLTADGQVKVLDFGVAKLTSDEGPIRETQALTATGALIGTPQYMAPEQAFADGEVDGRADLWATGVVMYECLCGARPIEADHVGQIFRALATGALVPIEKRDPSLPAGAVALVHALLAMAREERPPSARAVIDALDGLGAAAASDGAAAPGDPSAREVAPPTAVTLPGPPAPSRGGGARGVTRAEAGRVRKAGLALTVALLASAAVVGALGASSPPADRSAQPGAAHGCGRLPASAGHGLQPAMSGSAAGPSVGRPGVAATASATVAAVTVRTHQVVRAASAAASAVPERAPPVVVVPSASAPGPPRLLTGTPF